MLKVRVNPIQCVAHGLCAELLPERITLDEWGYPILDGSALSAELVKNARRADRFALDLRRAGFRRTHIHREYFDWR
jgi:ferredoxin